ncbi:MULTISPECIES: hypothetical protein [unclassified Microcoleus]|uniref:hypothetical protein n=1 Tax=unclassified Microcoleus TaxID=2642155 RepID=UPI0025F125F5|nr:MULTISPECIES: hypothetical protein [unclassified Microcoleus]
MTGIKKFQWTVLVVSLLGFLFLFSPPAYAGAGANVNACIYLPTKPLNSRPFNITVGGSPTNCMNNTGNNTQIKIEDAGITCGSVGYVEGDGSCIAESHWILGYNTSGGYNESIDTHWYRGGLGTGDNHMELSDKNPRNTQVCGTANRCNETEIQWSSGTQGPVYIIFSPSGT